MLKNKTIIATMIISIGLLFLTSCGQGGSGRETTSAYRSGSQGIEIQFKTGSPPSNIYAEDETFPIVIEVKNRGVFPGAGDDTINGNIYFVGFDHALITGLEAPLTFEFEEEEAKTRYNPEGGFTIIETNPTMAKNYFVNSQVDYYDADILAVACYPYQTLANIEVCIDPDPSRRSNQDTCEPSNQGTGTQGAPVAITSLESIPGTKKARFIIKVDNVGGGEVISEDSIGEECIDPDIDRTKENRVMIEEITLSDGQPLDCKPDIGEELDIEDGSGIITCTANIADERRPAYSTLLGVRLRYGYKDTDYTRVRILGGE